MERKKFIPVSYSVVPFEDDRYLKLRVKVMHLGLNLNNTNFDQASVDSAAESLKNVPILAYVKKQDGSDSADFAGHEFEFKITQEGIEYIYLGRPIGIIPETNNYELKADESGKVFVWVDAYIWKAYANESLRIIEDAGMKKVSMEIVADKMKWEEGPGYWDIKKYRYNGVTLLGDDVQEAMVGASAEVVNFSANSEVVGVVAAFKKQLDEILNFQKEEIVDEMVDETAGEIVDETADSQEVFENNEEVFENNEEVVENNEEVFENSEEVVDEPAEDTEEFVEEEFSLTEEILENSDKTAENNETFETNEREEDYASVIETLKAENEALRAELEVFRAEKIKKEVAELDSQKDSLIAQFSDLKEVEGYKAIISNKEKFNLEELELRLFALRGKFSPAKKEKEKEYDFAFLANYATKNNNEPEWADLVKNYKEEN